MALENISKECGEIPQPKTKIEVYKTDDGYDLHFLADDRLLITLPLSKKIAENLAVALLYDDVENLKFEIEMILICINRAKNEVENYEAKKYFASKSALSNLQVASERLGHLIKNQTSNIEES